MRARLTILLTAGFAAGLIAGGCGGDDETTTTTGATGGTGATGAAALSKDDYIAEADAICKEGDREIAQAAQSLGSSPTDAETEQFATEEFVPALRDQVEQLRALPAPEGDEDTVAEIHDALEQGVDELEDDPSLMNSAEGPPSIAEASQLAKDYGLKSCGSS